MMSRRSCLLLVLAATVAVSCRQLPPSNKTTEELASIRHKVAFGTRPSYTRQELLAGKTVAEKAVKLAGQRRDSSAGKVESLSQH